MAECIKCDDGTLERQESGYYVCNSCGKAVAPDAIRDRRGRRISGRR